MMLTLRQLRFVLLLVALHLRGVNGMDSPPPPVPVVERHLVCQGCKETKISELFSSLKDELVQRIDFTLQKGESGRQVDPTVARRREGLVHSFIENEPDFEALGVNRTDEELQSTELFPDNAKGGKEIGHEFCRVAHSIAPATIALLYGPKDAAHSTVRIHNFIAGVLDACPEASHNFKYSFYADWSSDKAAAIMSPVFLRDGSINAVIAANDDMALGALVSAREMRPDKKLLVAGYDAISYTIPLLQSGDMFATVDQTPPTGLAYSLQVMLSDKATGAGNFGEPSNCSLSPGPSCQLEDYNTVQSSAWNQLIASLPNKVSTAVTIRVKDPSRLVLRERLLLYNPAVPPPTEGNGTTTNPVPVFAQLKNCQIFKIDAASQSTLCLGLMTLSWKDSRLAWSTIDYPNADSIRVDISTIWHPTVVLSNLVKSGSAEPVQSIRTTVYSDGQVVWEQNIRASEFRCGSIDDTILHFPFDQHVCGVDLTSYSVEEFTLALSVEVPDDVAFDVTVANDDWDQVLDTGPGLDYQLDRGGMAIATILAALALRESMVSAVDTAFTLLDVFLLLSLCCFHFVGFLITAYESSYQQIKRRKEFRLGYGDKLGKYTLSAVFGIVNMTLSVFWANGIWSLFYLSLAEIIGCVLLNVKARKRVKHKVSEQFKKYSMRDKLGLSVKQNDEELANPENIVRYMRWRTVASKEIQAQDMLDGTSRMNLSTQEGSDEGEGDPEQQAADVLQRALRNSLKKKGDPTQSTKIY